MQEEQNNPMNIEVRINNAQSGGACLEVIENGKVVWEDRLHLISKRLPSKDALTIYKMHQNTITGTDFKKKMLTEEELGEVHKVE